MKFTKKFTAIQLSSQNVDDEIIPTLKYGSVEGPYYNTTRPTEEFDTEEEAIEYAYRINKYSNWLIYFI